MSATPDPKVIVIGSGPAGYTAAIYLGRANIPHVLFEGTQPGGQLTITTAVENFPGFPEGIQGPELMDLFRAQAQRFGTRIVGRSVTGIEVGKQPYVVTTDDGARHTCHAIIVATGATARWLGLPEEESFHGKGLSACATCDGFFFRGQEIAVIGGGDTAMEEALFLTNFASKVTVVHRRGELRASVIMQERALAHPKIEFAWHKKVKHYLGDLKGNLTGLLLEDVRDRSESRLDVTGCFIAIGHTPSTKFLEGVLDLDEQGYVKVVPGSTCTSVDGVFASGDAQDHVYRQAITAAGTGCMAAIEAERWLNAKGL